MPDLTPEVVAEVLAAAGIDPNEQDLAAVAADWTERTAFSDTLDRLVAGIPPVDPHSRFDPSWEEA